MIHACHGEVNPLRRPTIHRAMPEKDALPETITGARRSARADL